MNLHHRVEEFEELIELTSNQIHIPTAAVRKDYFITIVLNNLARSEFVDEVVFKGGTSLSKCYPGSIDRFSEDIDLTYIPDKSLSDGKINRKLKTIEIILIAYNKGK